MPVKTKIRRYSHTKKSNITARFITSPPRWSEGSQTPRKLRLCLVSVQASLVLSVLSIETTDRYPRKRYPAAQAQYWDYETFYHRTLFPVREINLEARVLAIAG